MVAGHRSMFDIGWGEWIVILFVVLLVVGPKKIPVVARNFGRALRGFQHGMKEFTDEIKKDIEPPKGK